MYKSPKIFLIHKDKISQTFPLNINIGPKQCNLISTILFNIYIKNFPGRWLEDSRSINTLNDIPYLVDTKINNLLFWDDVLLRNFFAVKRGFKNIDIRTI